MEQQKYSTDAYSPDYAKDLPPVVVTTQPTTVITSPPAHKDCLVFSILNMIFCCLPLGIAALVFSIKTRDANDRQDLLSAVIHSRKASSFNWAALGLGIIGNGVWIGLVIYGIVIRF